MTDKNPEEITIDKESEEIATDKAPEEITANETPEEITADESPKEVTADETTKEVAADESPEEVTADESPEEVTADETPEEVVADESSEEVVADESPEEVTAVVKPVEAIVDKIPEEHYVKQGDPDKPTYYIIRRLPETTGFLARYRMVAGHVRYAMSKGWIPVVDMQNYASPYLDPKKFGKENAWEYYFEQPLRIGLDEAYSGENIILSNGDCVKPYPGHSLKMLERVTDELTEWRMLIKLGLIKIKPALMEEILAIRDSLFSREDRVLGVNMRGTDYLVRKIKGRPIPPPVDFAKSIVNAKLKDWNCNKFFLATEDKKILESFQDTFGYRCVILDRGYVDYNSIKDKWVSVCRINRENDHYLQGKEYLTQIVILSMCNSLVAARCSGTTTAMMLADKFEHTYFFNVGRYGNITLD